MKEDILARFDLLVAKISEVSPEIWAIYVKQQCIWGGMAIVGGALCFLLLFYLVRYIRKNGNDDGFGPDPSVIMATVFFLFASIGLVGCFIESVRVFNPEYYALQNLIGFLK